MVNLYRKYWVLKNKNTYKNTYKNMPYPTYVVTDKLLNIQRHIIFLRFIN